MGLGYTVNTELLLSFHPHDFHSCIFEIVLKQIPSWMTANLLTLNWYKTDFCEAIALKTAIQPPTVYSHPEIQYSTVASKPPSEQGEPHLHILSLSPCCRRMRVDA